MQQKVSLTNKLLFIVFTLSALIGLFNSCRKDTKEVNSQQNNVAEMQSEFSKLGYNAKLYESLNDTSRIKWTPRWNAVTIEQSDSINYTYVPLSIGIQVIRTGKLSSQSIKTNLVKYIIVETVKNKNHYLLATYQNTDTSKQNLTLDFRSFTGATYLFDLGGGRNYVIGYNKSKRVNNVQEFVSTAQPNPKAKTLTQVLQCYDTYTCSWATSCSAGVFVTSTSGVGPPGCPIPSSPGLALGCTPGTYTWSLTSVQQGTVCEWVDPNAPPPLPPCQNCTPPPPTPPLPGDPCDGYKASGAHNTNLMVSGNNSIANALNQTITNSKNGSESAFHIDNVNGSFVASTPVLTTSEGAPFSSTNINSNTVAIGHDHDASSFPQPSPYDIYSMGELAVTTNGKITMDYTTSANSNYVLVVTNISAFKTFLSNYPESNLTSDGDLVHHLTGVQIH
jgi:hypothetical protein